MKTRRNFLRQIAASAIFLPLAEKLHASPARPLRVAFCGLGSYANRCAEAIQGSDHIKIAGVISGTPSKIKAWQEKYQIPARACYSYEEMGNLKNNPDIDVVYVTSVNSAHHPHTLAVARAGKHVICEKPMAITVAEAEEMIAVCKQHNVKLLIGYRLHFEPFTCELIRMRTAGELGQISFVNATMGFRIGDPTQWRLKKALAGGGAMYDVGIYCINGARYATGEEPNWVAAQELKTDPVKFSEVDETITWQMGFPSGVIANCATTYNFNHFDQLYVAGNKDFFELSPAFGYGPMQGRTGKGPVDQPVVTHQKYQLDGMSQHFLTGDSLPNCDGEEGLKDMKIMAAIYESIIRGGERILLHPE